MGEQTDRSHEVKLVRRPTQWIKKEFHIAQERVGGYFHVKTGTIIIEKRNLVPENHVPVAITGTSLEISKSSPENDVPDSSQSEILEQHVQLGNTLTVTRHFCQYGPDTVGAILRDRLLLASKIVEIAKMDVSTIESMDTYGSWDVYPKRKGDLLEKYRPS